MCLPEPLIFEPTEAHTGFVSLHLFVFKPSLTSRMNASLVFPRNNNALDRSYYSLVSTLASSLQYSILSLSSFQSSIAIPTA